MALRRNTSAADYRDRGAAPQPADGDLRARACVALLGELFWSTWKRSGRG